ncbi:DEAD/DEAH box helicase [Ornithobacterium rhinotracheale]|uniref:DEAD/DEAH box helicase n=1 Tax=Ornithobacterium rhinotracheale TaxID=28251 RepID=A0A3R6AUH6_ORNRH|nr:helicase-related protein [Ornithobacterium rhinotracheale]QAR30821.1 DEAD/DEAH box helicase [Ornithobacterium rhinotracheale]
MFQVNQRVCLKDDTSYRGVISEINGDFYCIRWDNGNIGYVSSDELIVEQATNPWERLADNDFDDYSNFTISSISNKVKNTSSNTISTLKASKTIFKPYQFIPLLKLLNSNNRRIIVADEVGLGKTISAGHIALELAARNELESLLIVCLNSLQEKWIDEFANKFNLYLEKIESIESFRNQLEAYRDRGEKIFAVINYEKFQRRENIEYFKDEAIDFDLIIFDEAHTLRNKKNSWKSLKSFVELAKAVVMLTATPIMTSLENLYNLVELLDDDNFSNYQIFQNAININKPFIRAYNQLSNGESPSVILRELNESEVVNVFRYGDVEFKNKYSLNDILGDNNLYRAIIKSLSDFTDGEISPKEKVNILEMLININSLNHFYTRTRKKDVMIDSLNVQRNPQLIKIELNDQERSIYEDKINSVYDDIGAIQVKRKYSSSLFADLKDESDYDNLSLDLSYDDSKFNALLEVVKRQNEEQIIVFSFFRKTLLYLRNRLHQCGYKIALIYGGQPLQERNNIIEKFRNGDFQILLSSEVGSTGLNLQFCNRIINYDLPWNPMVIEQRIGRIDRIGQKSPIINIFNFVYEDTIEERIYEKLYERINLFRESIGDLDDILGEESAYVAGIIENIYKDSPTNEEIENRLNRLAVAIEHNRSHLRQIEEGLRDSFSNDLYFENEIKNIDKNQQYLTENDLIEYIYRIISNKLTTLRINKDEKNPNIYNIYQPSEDVLFDFIEQYYESENIEQKKMLNSFKRKHYSKDIRCTFNQDLAFENKNIEYISAYHPLTMAIYNYFKQNEFDRNNVYRYALNINKIDDEVFKKDFKPGYYFLARYEFEIQKNINGKLSNFVYLKSSVVDLTSGDSFILHEDDSSDYFVSICQKYKTIIPESGIIELNREIISLIQNKYIENLMKQKNDLMKKEKLKFDSEVERKTNQEISYKENRINILEDQIHKNIGLANVLRAQINDLNKQIEQLKQIEGNSNLLIKDKLISLNLVYIYG